MVPVGRKHEAGRGQLVEDRVVECRSLGKPVLQHQHDQADRREPGGPALDLDELIDDRHGQRLVEPRTDLRDEGEHLVLVLVGQSDDDLVDPDRLQMRDPLGVGPTAERDDVRGARSRRRRPSTW